MAGLQGGLAENVGAAVKAEFGAEYADTDPLIRPSAFADFQSNVALALAKRLGRQPREIAGLIVGRLGGSPMLERAEISGAGFINITVRDAWLGEAATAQLRDPRLGVETTAQPQHVVVDYSAPNVAKEMHVGHLRTTIVGDAFVRVLERLGHDVIRANHIGDWGTNFGMLVEHLVDIGEEVAYAQLAGGEIKAVYQSAQVKFDADPAFADRSRRRVGALQAGDAQTQRLWRRGASESQAYYKPIFRRPGGPPPPPGLPP